MIEDIVHARGVPHRVGVVRKRRGPARRGGGVGSAGADQRAGVVIGVHEPGR